MSWLVRGIKGRNRRHGLVVFAVCLMVWFADAPMAGANSLPIDAGPTIAARYHLDVQLDDAKRTVAVRETVDATNHTGTTLTSLVFNVTPRAYNAFDFNSAVVDAKPVAPTFDNVVMDVPLPIPLPPNQSTSVALQFTLTIPSPGNFRFGSSDGVLRLGNWFPILAVHRANGWDRHHYSPVGDPFFTEAADYTVNLHADPHLIVAHTGILKSHQGGTWQIVANGVRDFALVMSRRYEIKQTRYGNTVISAFYLPEDRIGGHAILDYAKQAFAWYEAHLGPYGYPSFMVAETPSQTSTDVGQEYPNLIYIAAPYVQKPTPPGYYLTYLVAHETGHQWLYGLVGNDHVRQPWLDEGPVVELSYQFIHDHYPAAYEAQWKQLEVGYQQAVATYGKKPLDSTESDFQSETEYYDVLYRGAAIFLDDLRIEMGDSAYYKLWSRYVATYRGGNATTRDFLLLAEQVSGKDLTTLYKQYFRPASYALATPTPALTPTLSPTTVRTASPVPTVPVVTTAINQPTIVTAGVSPITSAIPTVRPVVPSATPSAVASKTPLAQPTISPGNRAKLPARTISLALGIIIAISAGGLLLVSILTFGLFRNR